MSDIKSILLIGFGNMGQALYHGWCSKAVAEKITVFDPFIKEENLSFKLSQNSELINDVSLLEPLYQEYDIIVFAVKPQIFPKVKQDLSSLPTLIDAPIVISIMAGTTLKQIEAFVGTNVPVIRTMPNTPAMIGKGVTVACPNESFKLTQRDHIEALLKPVGKLFWVDDEDMMHAVTAVSGSGPGYIFYLVETLEQAARKLGLPDDIAGALARQTVVGAGALLEDRSDLTAETLREMVTSPKGTTEAGLKILMDGKDGLEPLLEKVVRAAATRSQELAED